MIRNIFVVSELYYPEDTSTGYYLTKIAEGLAQHFSVCVLCAKPTYSMRGTISLVDEEKNRVQIHRCLATSLDHRILLFKTLNLLTISISIFLNVLLRVRQNDLVLVVTNPPLMPFFVAIACWLRHVKFILLIHDVYPEILSAVGLFHKGNVLVRSIAWATRWLYRCADLIVTLGRDMRKLVGQKLGIKDSSKVVIITNWADVGQIVCSSRTENHLLGELNIGEKFVIQYSGNLGRTHWIEGLFECVKSLSSERDIHFLFIGWGAKHRWLQESLLDCGLENATVLPPRPREVLSDSLNACDVAIISLSPGMLGLSVPSRLYNILASGKPVIAVTDPQSELGLVVKEESVGWVVPPGDPQAVVRAVLEAKSDPGRLSAISLRARSVAERKYSFQKVLNTYSTFIEKVSESN